MFLRKSIGMAIGLALLLSVLLTLGMKPQPAGAPVPDLVNSIWIGTSEGIVKFSGKDGAKLLEIRGLGEVLALAIDEEDGRVWAFTDSTLYAYNRRGERLSATSIPSGESNRIVLAVDPSDRGVWLGEGKTLYRLNSQGVTEFMTPLPHLIEAMSMDPHRSRIWVATQKALMAYDTTGAPIASIDPGKQADIAEVAFESTSDSLWVATEQDIYCYGGDGILRTKIQIGKIDSMVPDGEGGLWIAKKKLLTRIDSMGHVLFEVEPFNPKGHGTIEALVLNPSDHSVWGIDTKALIHVSEDGALLHYMEPVAKEMGHLLSLVLYSDLAAPIFRITSPSEEEFLNTNTPNIEVNFEDPGSGVDTSSLAFQINNISLKVNCIFEENSASCTPRSALPDGETALSATVKDFTGNTAHVTGIRFTIDTVKPQITVEAPRDGLITNQPAQTIMGSVNEPAMLTVNGQPVTFLQNLTFSSTVTLQEGNNTFTIRALDRAGNEQELPLLVTLDTIPPPLIDSTHVTIGPVINGHASIAGATGCFEPGMRIKVTNNVTQEARTVTVFPDGGFTIDIPALSGESVSIVVMDLAGNESPALTFIVNSSLPPAAKKLPEGSFGEKYRSLVPADATIEEYSSARFSLITGTVYSIDGSPLPEVIVSILDHSEYGTSITNAEGEYTLPVEGGGIFTVSFVKKGYLEAQRKASTEWNQIHTVDGVFLLQEDTACTTIDFDGNPASRYIHVSSAYTDEDGVRSTTLVFSGDTTVTIKDAEGNESPVNTPITVRATEFVKPETMPAHLPSTSAYTFAVDLTVDGVAQRSQVHFSKPVTMYVDNFLEFPVGEVVPVGYYDRIKAVWVPYDNGLVIKLLDLDGDGTTDALDANGDESADDLNKDGSFGDEVAGIAGNGSYQPGKTYWRVKIDHFTPWDCNWPWDFEEGAVGPPKVIPPPPNQNACEQKLHPGSTVMCESGIFEEDIPLLGTGMTLHYKSQSAPGYQYPITIPVTEGTVPQILRKVRAKVSVAGRVFNYELDPQPNQSIVVNWDGFDHLGHRMSGEVPVHVEINYDYPLRYASAGRGGTLARAFGNTGYNVIAQRNNQSISASLGFDYDLVIHAGPSLNNQFAEGWTLSEHHSLSAASHTIWKGDGEILEPSDAGYLEVVAGGGSFNGDGKSGLETAISLSPGDINVAADGSILFIDGGRRIRSLGPDNIIRTIAGNGSAANPGANDGALATEVGLGFLMAFTLAPDGTLYFIETDSFGQHNSHVRHVTPEGRIETVAKFISSDITDIDAGPDGSLYVTREAANTVTKISPDGSVTDVVSVYYWPWGVNTRKDGSLFISSTFPGTVSEICTRVNFYMAFNIAATGWGASVKKPNPWQERQRLMLIRMTWPAASRKSNVTEPRSPCTLTMQTATA